MCCCIHLAGPHISCIYTGHLLRPGIRGAAGWGEQGTGSGPVAQELLRNAGLAFHSSFPVGHPHIES